MHSEALIPPRAKPVNPVILAEAEIDVTDLWIETTDPENEFGETADALFQTSDGIGLDAQLRCEWTVDATLVGLRVSDLTGDYYYTRAQALQVLGAGGVSLIESIASERLTLDM